VAFVPDGCFGDEVAIDFPSVDHLVERERATFLGEHQADGALTTEISLSLRDARIGSLIPLEVPIRCACKRCGGRGETWTEPCTACGGIGDSLVLRQVRLAVPAGVDHGARFRFRVACPDASSALVEVRVAVRSSLP
jgi:molecular chaperone DnaJ